MAGNEEDVKSVTFTIGDADGTPPVTTHELDRDGTTGPVTVRLSATDPDEPGSGGPAETHDVNALPSSWNPNTVQAATGDVVRWNFPEATAGAPHNVYLIQPDEAPDSAGHLVSDEVVLPGAPPVTATLDEAGTWTYVCKIHSHVENGHYVGMVGTAQVSSRRRDSRLGRRLHRVLAGRRRPGPLRQHRGRRSVRELVHGVGAGRPHGRVPVDRQRRQHRDDEVGRVRDRHRGSGRADGPGAADPSTGEAPLLVQLSATGRDPQNRPLIYQWDFGDGGGTADQSPQHTYTRAGRYTATVTVTDEQGKTGTDTVEVVVTAAGNQPPLVRASADPGKGTAPLAVEFSADALDPDGDARDVFYLWDFGDGGANAYGRDVHHTYRTKGKYTATVTATDSAGITDTEQVTIEVLDAPGNQAPTVSVAATPKEGSAPLRGELQLAVRRLGRRSARRRVVLR